jgi:hypothetical protein
MRNTAGELFPLNESRRCVPIQLLVTQEKRGPTGPGQKFRYGGFISRANAEFVAPYGMIPLARGVEAIEA